MSLRNVIVPLLLAVTIVVVTLTLTRRDEVANEPVGHDDAPAPAPAPQRPAPPVPAAAGVPGTATPAEPAAELEPPGDDVAEIDLSGNATFFSMLEELGIEDIDGKLSAWAAARGYPQLDEQGNPLLDQPYDQYDDSTLRAFADNGDMWAQQMLADRLAATRPAEAVELYRQAAINGSVHAMTEMARLYRDLAYSRRDTDINGDPAALEQAYALRDGPESLDITAYAWAVAAEQAGWDPLRGGMTASYVGAKLNDQQRDAACEYGQVLFAGLQGERAERGLGDYDQRPPPVVFDPGETGGTGCDTGAPSYLNACREVRVRVNGNVSRVWTCDE